MMAVAFLLGGVTSVQLATAEREERAIAAAAQAEEDRRERADAASEARLTGQATAVAAQRRLVALEAASAALAAADAALVDATPMVGADTIDPLVEASARLAALVEQAPDPGTVLGAPAMPSAAEVAATEVTTLAATGTAATDVPALSAEPSDSPAPTTTPADGTLTAVGRAQAPTVLAATNPAALVALDGATSEELLRTAEEVSALVEQVRRAAEDAAAAQAAAAQAAEEARIAAEQAAAEEFARKIAAADAAPNGDIPVDVLCAVSFDAEVLLRCDAAAALELLNVAFRDHFGHDLSVSDSYRTYDEQVAAKANRGDLAATPGTSNHGRGLAIDLNGFGAVGQFDRPFYRWMAQNARDFGWHHPRYMSPGGSGPLEPWHWEYDTGTG